MVSIHIEKGRLLLRKAFGTVLLRKTRKTLPVLMKDLGSILAISKQRQPLPRTTEPKTIKFLIEEMFKQKPGGPLAELGRKEGRVPKRSINSSLALEINANSRANKIHFSFVKLATVRQIMLNFD